MKIAFLYDAIYPYNKGGKEKRSFDITTQLARDGHDIHIYTMNWWNGSQIKNQDKLTLHAISPYYPLYKGKIRSIKEGIMFGLASFKLFKENFDVLDADHMVYFHLFPAWLVCKLKGKKFIITWNEVWGKQYWTEYMGKKGFFGYLMEKLASKLPDKIISISNLTTQNLINKLNVPKEKIATIPNGIDIQSIAKIKPSKEKSDILFAGRLLSHKNVNVLIKAVELIQKSNKKIKCTIVGDGPELNALKNLVKNLKLEKNITFKGFIENHNDVLALIKSSKVFVLPSSREGFGIVVIEALACSTPVVTINHNDNASKDLIQEGKNGFIADLSPESLSASITKVLNASNTKNMKLQCVKSASQYDWQNIMDKIKGVYGI